MNSDVTILIIEAVSVYLLVLWTHSLRSIAGLAPFYALLGGITAIMSWVTDAGVQVQAAGITFMVGSAVFYTSLLLGVFVVYVFDGPRPTRMAILTIAGVSIMVPVIALVLHAQMALSGHPDIGYVPVPSLRTNTASVLATVADLIFLAIAWEFLGRPELRVRTWLRAFFTLLGVMWLDVLLFNTGAFAGTPHYLNIMTGTMVSRLAVSLFAFPFLYVYLNWQNRKMGSVIENRPVLSILKEVAEVRARLDEAQEEIERRQQAEAALRESEERYRMVMETASDMIFLHDLDGHITYANRAAVETSGYAVENILKQTIFDFLPPEEVKAVQDRMKKRQQQLSDVFLYESIFLDHSGNHVPVEVSSSMVTRGGKPAEMLIMARDIRQRQRIEAERDRLRTQLMEAQKMEAVGQLAGGIAHDFNNLLTAVNGYAELIQYHAQEDRTIRDMASKIQNASVRAAGLVRQLLAFARQQHIQPQSIDLNMLIQKELEFEADRSTHNIQISANFQPDLWPLLIDPGQAYQLVDSLLCHVRDATPVDGQILLQTSNIALQEDDPVAKPEMRPGDYVRFDLTHSGRPLEENVRQRIFEPFFFTSDAVADGIGLRLAAVYGIVKQNNGYIIVDSPADNNTRHQVFLPRAPEH